MPQTQYTEAQLRAMDKANRTLLETGDFACNFLVSAGAGAGKSHTIVARLINLLTAENPRVTPAEVVAITFTNKATAELKSKLMAEVEARLQAERDPGAKARLTALQAALPNLQISTIHAFCRRILSEYPMESGIGFAPLFEEGAPVTARRRAYFNRAWSEDALPQCRSFGLGKGASFTMFRDLCAACDVTPVYRDVNSAAFQKDLADWRQEVDAILTTLAAAAGPGSVRLCAALAAPLAHPGTVTDAERQYFCKKLYTLCKESGIIKDVSLLDWRENEKTTTEKKLNKLMEPLFMAPSPTWGAALLDLRENPGKDLAEIKDAELLMGLRFLEACKNLAALPDCTSQDGAATADKLCKLCEKAEDLFHAILTDECLALREEYCRDMLAQSVFSSDDQLRLATLLVRNNPTVRTALHSKYKVFFVDEYQDTDPQQTELIFSITAQPSGYNADWRRCTPAPGSLFLVGDPKQAIYRFRRADISLWNEAAQTLTAHGGKAVSLYLNFRSAREICTAAGQTFGTGKALAMMADAYQADYSDMVAHRGSVAGSGVFTYTVAADGAAAEAARQIAALIAARVATGQYQYSDFLLLSFKREKNPVYAEELRKKGIPVRFDGSFSVQSRPELSRLMARVAFLRDPADEPNAFAVLQDCYGITPDAYARFRRDLQALPPAENGRHYPTTLGGLTARAEALPPVEGLPDHAAVLDAIEKMANERANAAILSPCELLQTMLRDPAALLGTGLTADEAATADAAVRQIIAQLRAADPLDLEELDALMAELAETSMDRMPDLRDDDNVVRLMNLHKSKGLEGRVVFLLPAAQGRAPVPLSHIERVGTVGKGWFVAYNGDASFTFPLYTPPDWTNKKAEETNFLQAERTRLLYVALTRAAEELHVYNLSDKPSAWAGIAGTPAPAAAQPAPEAAPELEVEPAPALTPQGFDAAALATAKLLRQTPSGLEKPGAFTPAAKTPDPRWAQLYKAQAHRPSGAEWGTALHRVLELLVQRGVWDKPTLHTAAEQAVTEAFTTELLPAAARAHLQLPTGAVTLAELRQYITAQAEEVLAFVLDEGCTYRRVLADAAACWPELTFTLSVAPDDTALYQALTPLAHPAPGQTIELNGSMDLVVRDKKGRWLVLDYKTDRIAKDEVDYLARLTGEYGPQLKGYRAVLERLSGAAPAQVAAVLCPVPLAGELARIP